LCGGICHPDGNMHGIIYRHIGRTGLGWIDRQKSPVFRPGKSDSPSQNWYKIGNYYEYEQNNTVRYGLSGSHANFHDLFRIGRPTYLSTTNLWGHFLKHLKYYTIGSHSFGVFHFWYILLHRRWNMKLSFHRGVPRGPTTRYRLSAEMSSTAAELYEKSHLKRLPLSEWCWRSLMELRLFDRTVALAICRYHMHTQFLRIYHIYSGRDEPCLVTFKLTNSLIASISI